MPTAGHEPMDGLVAALVRETDARVEEIRARTRATADERAASARRARAARRDAEISALRARIERELAGERAAANAEARALLLAARHRLLDRVATAAERALASVTPEIEWLADAVARARRVLPPGGVAVTCPPATADRVRALVPAEWRVEPDPRAAPGVTLRDDAGRITVDGTLLSALTALRPQLARRTLDELEKAS